MRPYGTLRRSGRNKLPWTRRRAWRNGCRVLVQSSRHAWNMPSRFRPACAWRPPRHFAVTACHIVLAFVSLGFLVLVLVFVVALGVGLGFFLLVLVVLVLLGVLLVLGLLMKLGLGLGFLFLSQLGQLGNQVPHLGGLLGFLGSRVRPAVDASLQGLHPTSNRQYRVEDAVQLVFACILADIGHHALLFTCYVHSGGWAALVPYALFADRKVIKQAGLAFNE